MTPVKPTGGTFTVRHRHGVSDPVPYNASAKTVADATATAVRRDEVITAAHRLDREACTVCNPPARPQLHIPLRRRWFNWRQRQLLRLYTWLKENNL